MEKRFIEKWDKNKGRFKEWLKVYHNDCDNYHDLVKAIIEIVLNEEHGLRENYSSEIQEVDFGDFQGTLIFLFTKKCYQPSIIDTCYTSVDTEAVVVVIPWKLYGARRMKM